MGRWALRIAVLILLGVAGPDVVRAEEGPLGLGDLAAYQAALRGPSEGAEAPVAVGFRELWDHPERFQGRRVQVSGTVVRRFRQGAYGTFPPLDEVWVVSPSGNPLCLVAPSEKAATAKLGDTVRFVGTYLKRIQYQGGDVPRLAPLVVGDRPPGVTKAAPGPSGRGSQGWSAMDWTVGLVAVGLVVLVLGRQHLRRPVRSPLNVDVPGPAPEFVQPGFEDGEARV